MDTIEVSHGFTWRCTCGTLVPERGWWQQIEGEWVIPIPVSVICPQCLQVFEAEMKEPSEE